MFIEITVNQCRYDMSSLDSTKKAYCYGYIKKIENDRVLLKDVFVQGITEQGSSVSFCIDHVWLFSRGMRKAADSGKIQSGRYVRFRGRPYLYTRKDNTKDWALVTAIINKLLLLMNLNIVFIDWRRRDENIARE